jgi:hypothetical protein
MRGWGKEIRGTGKTASAARRGAGRVTVETEGRKGAGRRINGAAEGQGLGDCDRISCAFISVYQK